MFGLGYLFRQTTSQLDPYGWPMPVPGYSNSSSQRRISLSYSLARLLWIN